MQKLVFREYLYQTVHTYPGLALNSWAQMSVTNCLRGNDIVSEELIRFSETQYRNKERVSFRLYLELERKEES